MTFLPPHAIRSKRYLHAGPEMSEMLAPRFTHFRTVHRRRKLVARPAKESEREREEVNDPFGVRAGAYLTLAHSLTRHLAHTDLPEPARCLFEFCDCGKASPCIMQWKRVSVWCAHQSGIRSVSDSKSSAASYSYTSWPCRFFSPASFIPCVDCR